MPNGEVIPEEVFFQNKVKHPAIIESLGHFWHGDSVVMVMEAPEKPCDLADYLVENELINEGEARGIFRKVGGTVRGKGRGGGGGGGRGPQGLGAGVGGKGRNPRILWRMAGGLKEMGGKTRGRVWEG